MANARFKMGGPGDVGTKELGAPLLSLAPLGLQERKVRYHARKGVNP
jgi:hypothetical protein